MHTNQPVLRFQSQSWSFSFMAPLLGTIRFLAFYFYSHSFFQYFLPFSHLWKKSGGISPTHSTECWGYGVWASSPRVLLAKESREFTIHWGGPVRFAGVETSGHIICFLCIHQDAPFWLALSRTGRKQRIDSGGFSSTPELALTLKRASMSRVWKPGAPFSDIPVSLLSTESQYLPLFKIYIYITIELISNSLQLR